MPAPGRLLCIGAHPDDCEVKAAGLAALWTSNGGEARFLAMTDGSAGHHELAGQQLVAIRRAEAAAGAAAVGADSVVLDNVDGALEPSLDNRYKVIRAIREFRPDVVATHRTCDYHPDHRYTGVVVQDACYMLMVPNVLPGARVPDREPVVIFMADRFTKPYPLQADLVFDIDSVLDAKLTSIMSHTSQMLEWLPWVNGYFDELPVESAARRQSARTRAALDPIEVANRYRAALVAKYGTERGSAVRNAEVFEVCEYGRDLTGEASRALFPF